MIYSLANVGKCFIGSPFMAGRFLWVCQGLSVLQSVLPPILLSIFPPSFCSFFSLFRSVSFLGIYTLVSCDIWHGIRGPCEIVCVFYRKIWFWQKWQNKKTKNKKKKKKKKKKSKMAQKWDFSTILKNFVVNFCLKH